MPEAFSRLSQVLGYTYWAFFVFVGYRTQFCVLVHIILVVVVLRRRSWTRLLIGLRVPRSLRRGRLRRRWLWIQAISFAFAATFTDRMALVTLDPSTTASKTATPGSSVFDMIRTSGRFAFAPRRLRRLECDLLRKSRVIRRILEGARNHVVPDAERGSRHLPRSCGILDIGVGISSYSRDRG